jgi:Methyl-viologen-reducing hydrogenase, delta subunit
MTKKRMSFLQELLPFVGLGGRLRLEWISSAEANKFVQVVTEFTQQIRDLGPNPLARNYERPLESLDLAPQPLAGQGGGCGCGRPAGSVDSLH